MLYPQTLSNRITCAFAGNANSNTPIIEKSLIVSSRYRVGMWEIDFDSDPNTVRFPTANIFPPLLILGIASSKLVIGHCAPGAISMPPLRTIPDRLRMRRDEMRSRGVRRSLLAADSVVGEELLAIGDCGQALHLPKLPQTANQHTIAH